MKLNLFNFEKLSKHIEIGQTKDSKWHQRFLRELKEFYDVSSFESVYPRNFYNDDKEDELIVFLEDGYINVRKDEEDKVIFTHSYCKVTKKSLVTRRITNDRQLLKLTYDDGSTLELDSAKDSNVDYDELYSEAIRNLYKKL